MADIKVAARPTGPSPRTTGRSLMKDLIRDRYLYLLLLPGLLLVLLFRYGPMYGVVIAFQDYNIYKGIRGSQWVGFAQFERLFRSPDFYEILGNTVIISLYKLSASFVIPIVLALLLNELRSVVFRRFAQSVVYLPHFISWVIFSGIIITFLNPVDGMVNTVIQSLGGKPIDFLGDVRYFRSMLVVTDIYKEVGWGTIIYLAAIAGVNPDLYEAARIDGASKLRQMWHVTLPAIRPVIVILVILSLANVLEAGFQQIFLLYNALVYDVADIIDTYVYRVGIYQANYSFATAAGLFKSAVAMTLILTVNTIVKKSGQQGLW